MYITETKLNSAVFTQYGIHAFIMLDFKIYTNKVNNLDIILHFSAGQFKISS